MQASHRTDNALWPWGLTLLRVVVGLASFMHGYQKVFQQGVGGFFGSLGIPAPGVAAIVVSVVELVGGLALIVGLLKRLFGVLLAVDMLVALLVFHRPNGFFVGDGGIELVLVLGAAALALALTGPGALALDHQLPFERRFAGRDRSGLAPSRG